MFIEVRKTLAWATTAAAIVSAVMLALNDGSLPRLDAPARSGSIRAAPATPAH